MNLRKNYRLFYFQSFISSAPTVLLVTLIPFLLDYLFKSRVTMMQVGMLFFLIRISMIIGSNLAHFLMKRAEFHRLCAWLEIVHTLALTSLFFGVLTNSIFIFYGAIFTRFIGLGVLNNVRFSWLKHLDEFENRGKIHIYSKVFIQFSYIIAGFALMLFNKSENLLYITICLDIFTSIIGSILFFLLGELNAKKYEGERVSFLNLKIKKFRPQVLSLLIIDIFFAMSMGGVNTFIYRNGENYFTGLGGYGTVLILYAIFYLIAGNIIANLNKLNSLKQLSILGLGGAFLLVDFVNNHITCFVLFSFIFLTFSTFSLNLEKIWFDVLHNTEASDLFAKRIFLISTISAFGEYIYTFIPDHDLIIRSGFAFIAAFYFFFVKDSFKSNIF